MRRTSSGAVSNAAVPWSLLAFHLFATGCFSTQPSEDAAPVPGSDAATYGTDAANSSRGVELMSISATVDCSPGSPAEPWTITFDVRYNNSTSSMPFSAVISTASLAFIVPGVPDLDLAVTPVESGVIPPMETLWVTHTAVAVTPDLVDECELCGADAVLTLTYAVGEDSATVWAATDPTVACTY